MDNVSLLPVPKPTFGSWLRDAKLRRMLLPPSWLLSFCKIFCLLLFGTSRPQQQNTFEGWYLCKEKKMLRVIRQQNNRRMRRNRRKRTQNAWGGGRKLEEKCTRRRLGLITSHHITWRTFQLRDDVNWQRLQEFVVICWRRYQEPYHPRRWTSKIITIIGGGEDDDDDDDDTNGHGGDGNRGAFTGKRRNFTPKKIVPPVSLMERGFSSRSTRRHVKEKILRKNIWASTVILAKPIGSWSLMYAIEGLHRYPNYLSRWTSSSSMSSNNNNNSNDDNDNTNDMMNHNDDTEQLEESVLR